MKLWLTVSRDQRLVDRAGWTFSCCGRRDDSRIAVSALPVTRPSRPKCSCKWASICVDVVSVLLSNSDDIGMVQVKFASQIVVVSSFASGQGCSDICLSFVDVYHLSERSWSVGPTVGHDRGAV